MSRSWAAGVLLLCLCVVATRAPAESLSLPARAYSIAYDYSGNLFVADADSNRVLRRSAGGKWDIIIGPSVVNRPSGVAAARNGDVYVLDGGSLSIRVIHPDGRVATIAGAGTPRGGSLLKNPVGIAVDDVGNVYIADTSSGILRVGAWTHDIVALQVPVAKPNRIAVTGNFPLITLFVTSNDRLTVFSAWNHEVTDLLTQPNDQLKTSSFDGGRPIGAPYAVAALDDRSLLYSNAVDGTARLIDPQAHIGRVAIGAKDLHGDTPVSLAVSRDNVAVGTAKHGVIIFSRSKLELRRPIRPGFDYSAPPAAPTNANDYDTLVVGDSFIWWNTDWPDSIEGVLEKAVNVQWSRRGVRRRINVIPVQMPGADISSMVEYLRQAADLSYVRAAVLVIHAGLLSQTYNIPALSLGALQMQWSKRFTASLATLNSSMKANGLKLLVVLQPEEFELPARDSPLETLLSESLRSAGVSVLDLYPSFRPASQTQSLYGTTDKHLSAVGRRLTGDELARYLAPWLCPGHAVRHGRDTRRANCSV